MTTNTPSKKTTNRLNHQRHPEVLTALLTYTTTGAGARAFFPPPGRDPLPYFPQVGRYMYGYVWVIGGGRFLP